jgi:hypothetical protein
MFATCLAHVIIYVKNRKANVSGDVINKLPTGSAELGVETGGYGGQAEISFDGAVIL